MERYAMSPNEISAARMRYSDWTWRRGLAALKQFRAREGHNRVPRHHVEGTYKLGQWVAVQRYYYIKDIIKPARKAQLDALGFVWIRRDWLWEAKFAALQAYKARGGHCRVGATHIEGELKLGYWVSVQRRNKNKMSKERRQRLKEVGFAWRAWPHEVHIEVSLFGQNDTPLQTSVNVLN
jgi:hypothetical protein